MGLSGADHGPLATAVGWITAELRGLWTRLPDWRRGVAVAGVDGRQFLRDLDLVAAIGCCVQDL
jgi:hypothetical protein